MKYTKLGRTGLDISVITHGCMELGGGRWYTADKQTNIRLLQTAFEHGILSFDTAEGYGAGQSERIVGEALKSVRTRCVICSKVLPEHLHAQDVRRAAEGSLRNLDTDYIDLLYVHWPNREIPLEETLGEMQRLKEEGKIRAIGVSNFDLPLMQKALMITRIDALQPEFNLLERTIQNNGVLKFCKEHEISVLGYNSVAKGILTGAFHFDGSVLEPDDFRNQKPLFQRANMVHEQPLLEAIRNVAQLHQASMAQVAIAWVLAQAGMSSAIVGTQNEAHFMANLAASELELTQAEIECLSVQSEAVIRELE